MNDFYESVRQRCTCSECGGNQMDFAYLYEGGMVKRQTTVMGMRGYVGTANMLLIACTNCGYVEKTFLIGK